MSDNTPKVVKKSQDYEKLDDSVKQWINNLAVAHVKRREKVDEKKAIGEKLEYLTKKEKKIISLANDDEIQKAINTCKEMYTDFAEKELNFKKLKKEKKLAKAVAQQIAMQIQQEYGDSSSSEGEVDSDGEPIPKKRGRGRPKTRPMDALKFMEDRSAPLKAPAEVAPEVVLPEEIAPAEVAPVAEEIVRPPTPNPYLPTAPKANARKTFSMF